MARLPYVDPSSAPEPVREALTAVPQPLGVFRMVANASTAFRPWLRYGAALLTELELSPLLRELAILQVARLSDSEYEWVQHVPIARSTGATDEQIAAIEAGNDEDEAFDDRERAVLRFTRAVVVDGTANEPEVAALVDAFGPRQVVELLLVVGQYMSIARLLAVTDVELDEPVDVTDLQRADESPSS